MTWSKKDAPSDLVKEISRKYNCDLLTATILVRRGITEGCDILYYLEDEKRYLKSPYELNGVEDAVERILAAKEEGEKVLIFGDRDADGVTSLAILVCLLRELKMDVSWRVPTGEDPYGLTIEAVEEFAKNYGTLIITVDCGISNHKEIDRAAELNIDVIVTDHHRPQETLPAAYTIIDPKIKDGENYVYAFPDLAGCGVAYKLAQAIRFALKSDYYGQSICLLNTRPANDNAWIVEAIKIRNLVIIDKLTETIVPGMVGISDTRLPAFFAGQIIFTWDAREQKKNLTKIFGGNVEFGLADIQPEISKVIPQSANSGLFRLKSMSKAARYAKSEFGELDVFFTMFVSYIQTKEKLIQDDDDYDLQLAAIGTIADLMPLENENRILVRTGILSLINNARPGVSDLLFKLDLAGRRIDATDISWQLCPVINSSGRMGRANVAAQLFVEENPAEREKLANEILAMNDERKALGDSTWKIAEPIASKLFEEFGGKLAFAYSKDFPRGATGMTANKLVNRYKLPALVVSMNDEVATGSLRSARSYDLQGLLEQCADLFLDWGGHGYAAGFSLEISKWQLFLERLKIAASTIEFHDNSGDEETIFYDAELPLEYLNADIFKIINKLQPYGKGNKELLFLARGLIVREINLMGKKELSHIRLTLDSGKHRWASVYWNSAARLNVDFTKDDIVDAIFKIEWNWFKGNSTPQLNIVDLQRHALKK